jgi:2,4-dienoyl-CoA reductase-like NADH-dependent reductase (Old Yellow Enzyme family)
LWDPAARAEGLVAVRHGDDTREAVPFRRSFCPRTDPFNEATFHATTRPMTDRRRERLLPTTWPTAQQAEASRWFSPIDLGPTRAPTRTWVPAMVPWRATLEGEVTPDVIAWYERFALGRPGVLVVEATGVRDVPSGPLLRAGHERFVAGLSQVVDAVKRASRGHTRVFIQLIDFLAIKRRPALDAFLARFLAIDEGLRERLGDPWRGRDEAAVRAHLATLSPATLDAVLDERQREALHRGHRERVTDPHLAQLPAVLPGLFAAAAERCARAGFDGVELHCAHAYTLASFLSALNTRTDGYGGAREQRVRLPLEVFAAVRAAVPKTLAVGCRFLADEVIEGGSSASDVDFFATRFAAAGMDFLSLSRGGKFEDARQPRVGHAAYPYTGPSGHECMPTTRIDGTPWGRNRAAVARIKRALVRAGHATPVVLCGGIATFAQAEEALASGEADVVASARQALADPDWFLKVREGRGDSVRRCLFTNYCEGLDQAHEVVTCQLWDRTRGLPDDETVRRTADGRRLLAP